MLALVPAGSLVARSRAKGEGLYALSAILWYWRLLIVILGKNGGAVTKPRGYIRFRRGLLDHFRPGKLNGDLFGLFGYLLLRQDQSGKITTSFPIIASTLQWGKTTVSDRLKRLKLIGFITYETSSRGIEIQIAKAERWKDGKPLPYSKVTTATGTPETPAGQTSKQEPLPYSKVTTATGTPTATGTLDEKTERTATGTQTASLPLLTEESKKRVNTDRGSARVRPRARADDAKKLKKDPIKKKSKPKPKDGPLVAMWKEAIEEIKSIWIQASINHGFSKRFGSAIDRKIAKRIEHDGEPSKILEALLRLVTTKPRDWFTKRPFWSLAWLMRLMNAKREPCDNVESLLNGDYDENGDSGQDESAPAPVENEYGTPDPDWWPEGVKDNERRET